MDNKQVADMRKEHIKDFASGFDVRNITAKDAMVKPVFLDKDDDIERVLRKLKREDINVCIIVDKERKFIGEVSDEDIIKIFLHQVRFEPLVSMLNIGYNREIRHLKASDLANKHKSVVKKDTPINEVIEFLHKEGFNYIPVVNEKDKVAGVVTPSSVIDLLRKE